MELVYRQRRRQMERRMMENLERELREVKAEMERGLRELKKANSHVEMVSDKMQTITPQQLKNVEANTEYQIQGINALFDVLDQDRKDAATQRQQKREDTMIAEGGDHV